MFTIPPPAVGSQTQRTTASATNMPQQAPTSQDRENLTTQQGSLSSVVAQPSPTTIIAPPTYPVVTHAANPPPVAVQV
ncbi:unnamed protein product [Strongylus vulgaris]|uniref:Uncharacterized protein n=1 Tax=Strongylus vulgaris TaxID=40348 RepID=A0A3P7KIK2_STRVU|nr:unnamed protein product [Strongylus vulgaris]